jgi:hypothetical protein
MTRAERLVRDTERLRQEEVEAAQMLSEIRRKHKNLQLKNGAGTVLAYVDPDNGKLCIPCFPSSGGPQSPCFSPETAFQIAQFIHDVYTDKEQF